MTDFDSLTRDLNVKRNCLLAPVSEGDLENFEKSIKPPNFLPPDYRRFLRKYNGGSFIECVIMETPVGPVVVAQFYSLLEGDEYYIVRAWNNLSGYISEGFLPIAVDPGGSYFVIDLTPSRNGVVDFWDHENQKFTFIADSFSEFIGKMEVDS